MQIFTVNKTFCIPLMVGGLVLMLSACSTSSKRRVVQVKSWGNAAYSVARPSKNLTATAAQLYQAKLTDVPLPLGSSLLEQFGAVQPTQQGMMLAYATTMSREEVESFYAQEMEREGWRSGARLEGPETMLIFEKPRRSCIISLRPAVDSASGLKNTLLVIALAQK